MGAAVLSGFPALPACDQGLGVGSLILRLRLSAIQGAELQVTIQ